MEIIYMAGSYSSDVMDWCFENINNFTQLPGSKFHYLLAKGFLKNNVDNVHFMCALPIARDSEVNRNICFESEYEAGINYHYAPYCKNLLRRKIAEIAFYEKQIEKIIKEKTTVIICDVLNATASSTALKLAKKRGVKCYGIITDLPSFVNDTASDIKGKVSQYIANRNLSRFDGYIVITEAINDLVNTGHKPYVVVECVTDKDSLCRNGDLQSILTGSTDHYIYAGGMNIKYGIPELVDGFKMANLSNVELHLYGNGDYVDVLKNENLKAYNIIYHGVEKNEVVVEAEKRASLLINPRSPYEEFSKYSFPSKNMEYMTSGTPMIGYRLPGIPKEYFKYMYTFNEFSAKGVAVGLKLFHEENKNKHIEMGTNAKTFITKNKNNVIMAKKILDMILNGDKN